MITPARNASTCSLLCLALVFGSCAEGGDEDRPMSDVQVAAEHHVVGIIGALQFAQFPVQTPEASPLAGTFDLDADSAYSLRADGSTVFADSYALEETGRLTVFQPRANASTLVYAGSYGLEGDTGNYFFTDRVTGNVGLFFGVPRVDGAADLGAFEGDWHLLSMHVLFSPASALAAPDSIGRAFVGDLTVASDGTFTGSGSESTSPAAALPVMGTLRAFADGVVDLDIDYGGEARSFDGGGTTDIVALAGVDETNDRAAGLAVLMRRLTAAPTAAELAGEYDVGGWVLGVTPGSTGFDSVFGSLELTDAGQFRLQVSNNVGAASEQTGDFTIDGTEGDLLFEVTNPDEDWLGVVDAGHDTIVLVDNARSNSPTIRSALRFLVAIRRKPI